MGSWLATYLEMEAGSVAARNAIKAHLARLPGGEERDYWQAVAERYDQLERSGGTAAAMTTHTRASSGNSLSLRR